MGGPRMNRTVVWFFHPRPRYGCWWGVGVYLTGLFWMKERTIWYHGNLGLLQCSLPFFTEYVYILIVDMVPSLNSTIYITVFFRSRENNWIPWKPRSFTMFSARGRRPPITRSIYWLLTGSHPRFLHVIILSFFISRENIWSMRKPGSFALFSTFLYIIDLYTDYWYSVTMAFDQEYSTVIIHQGLRPRGGIPYNKAFIWLPGNEWGSNRVVAFYLTIKTEFPCWYNTLGIHRYRGPSVVLCCGPNYTLFYFLLSKVKYIY